MANYNLTQTGQQVQSDLNKVEGLAEIKSIGSGLNLSNAGELSASGNTGRGYTLTVNGIVRSEWSPVCIGPIFFADGTYTMIRIPEGTTPESSTMVFNNVIGYVAHPYAGGWKIQPSSSTGGFLMFDFGNDMSELPGAYFTDNGTVTKFIGNIVLLFTDHIGNMYEVE